MTLQKNALFQTLRTLCGFDNPLGIYDVPELLPDADGLRCGEGQIPEFMARLQKPDLSQRLFQIYATLLLPITLALAVLLLRFTSLGFLRAWLLLLLGAIPCAAMLSYAKPFTVLSRRLAGFGGALCGWYGARAFGGKHTIILRDDDLFPRSHISSNGMKLYGSYPAGQVISYALAALEAAGNPLTFLFEALLQAQYGKHSHASAYRYYDSGGIGAEIGADIVLVGALPFMRSMGVHMPEGTRVRQAVYVSVNGELAGIFAVKYKPSASTRAGLRAVLSNTNFSVILATRDFLLTPELIAARYELSVDRLAFPAFSERIRLSEAENDLVHSQGALIAKESFGAFASTVAAGQTLRTVTRFVAFLSLLVGVLGTALCALLLFWNSVTTASPFHIAAFQLLWTFLSSFISFILLHF